MATETPPQFSLRALMLLTVAAAVVAALGTMPERWAYPLILLLSLVAITMLVVGIIWGDAWLRTFCVGAILPLGTLAITVLIVVHVQNFLNRGGRDSSYLAEIAELWVSGHGRTHTAVTVAVSIALGLVATTTRRWIERRQAIAHSKAPAKRPPQPPPRPRRASTRIIFEFAGGPMDGKTVVGDAGDQGEAERYYLLTNRGQVGQRFSVASHYAIDLLSQEAPHEQPPLPRHTYEVTGQLEEDDEVLVRAEYVRRGAEKGE